jgi:HTH-type transcriptional regulator / antitoxin HipB
MVNRVQAVESAKELGAAVRLRRTQAGLKLAVAAPMCGVSVKFLQALETGKPTVQFDKALAVARQFGITLVIAGNP